MTKLHIETTGAGPDLVLLHGWGMHGGIWHGVRDELAQRFRLRVVDLPGYGESVPCEPYTLEHIVSLLAAQLPQPVAVCGWSLGGLAALVWARQSPQQVERLVLVGATPCFAARPDWPHGIGPEVLGEFALTLQRDYEGTLKRFLSLQARNGEDARKVMSELRSTLFARGRPRIDVLQAGLRILLETDLRPGLAGVRQPALLVHGEHDMLVPFAAGAWLQAHLPQARMQRIGGASHAPFLSHRQAFQAAVTEFLND